MRKCDLVAARADVDDRASASLFLHRSCGALGAQEGAFQVCIDDTVPFRFFQVEQSIVDDVNYTEAYPFDTATFSSAVSSAQSSSGTGVNVGGDVAFFFGPNVGVGVGVQYSSATVQMTLPSGASDVKAGGAQVGGGLRLRF